MKQLGKRLVWAVFIIWAVVSLTFVIDNVILGGAIVNTDPIGAWNEGPAVQGVRRMYELLAAEPRIDATAIQTVGEKDHDGFILGLVTEARAPS